MKHSSNMKIILCSVLCFSLISACLIVNDDFLVAAEPNMGPSEGGTNIGTGNSVSNVPITGDTEITGDEGVNGGSYSSSEADVSVIHVNTNNTLESSEDTSFSYKCLLVMLYVYDFKLTNFLVSTGILSEPVSGLSISHVSLDKTGDTSNTESSDFTGLNAALVTTNGGINVLDADISTNANGANAVFATGNNSVIHISDTVINTVKDASRGLDATYGGTIIGDNLNINTKGVHCAALATDRGEGIINVKNSILNTAGTGSPLLYSTGNISLSSSSGTATGSSIGVIEGKNSLQIRDCDLSSYAYGRVNSGIDSCGVMIYQSMSGDASIGVGNFTATNSKLHISSDSEVYKTAPMFFITNTNAIISLTSTTLDYGSNILIRATGNTGEWGTSGSNGGKLNFTANSETLKGNIELDSISSINIILKQTTLESTINKNNTGTVDLNLDSDSTWTVTGTSYINKITLANNNLKLIKDNGHTIYYNTQENTWLKGKTITLQNGGKLTPTT